MKNTKSKNPIQKTQASKAPAKPMKSKGLFNTDLKFHLFAPIFCFLALVLVAVCLLSFESDFLWKAQELNLHLDTSLFFQQQMIVPGGWLTWMGTYFTETFYHPALGVFLLVMWWALLMLLAGRAFRIPKKWAILLLIPVALLLLTCVDLGYLVYYLKLRGHFFSATIALSVVCALVWLFRSLPGKYYLRQVFILLCTPLFYPLLGAYALLATIVMAVMQWRLEDQKLVPNIIGSVVAVVCVIVVPIIYYWKVYYQTSLDNIYWAALPNFEMNRLLTSDSAEEKSSMVLLFNYYIPYILLAAFFIAMAATYRLLPSGKVKRPLQWGFINVVLMAVLIVGVKQFWYDDYNFHKELRMQHCMEQEDWQGILDEAADLQDEPTRAIVMMKNLALFRQGRQGDVMYHYLTGAKACNAPFRVNMTQVTGRSLYYQYGLPNYCYRWCMEDGVEYGWRAEYLKYMTRCALLNGEYRVARKYIDLLKHTRYHREWAESQERFLAGDGAMKGDKNYATIMKLMNFKDRLSSDQAIIEQFLMNHFMYDESDDPLFQEQAAYAGLWSKDIATFWRLFFQYAQSHNDQHMPVHLQEAAYLYGHLENNVDISGMPFDESVKKTYDQFMAAAGRYKGMKEEQLKDILFPQFGHTFYYEYFLIRNQKLY